MCLGGLHLVADVQALVFVFILSDLHSWIAPAALSLHGTHWLRAPDHHGCCESDDGCDYHGCDYHGCCDSDHGCDYHGCDCGRDSDH